MAKKSLLFIGILLLVIGILIRKLTEWDGIGLFLILLGVICKTIYIIGKIKTGEYNPGKELYFLGIGLILFLGGIFMKKNNLEPGFLPAVALIIIGLALKIVFIILFILKLKSARLENQESFNSNRNNSNID